MIGPLKLGLLDNPTAWLAGAAGALLVVGGLCGLAYVKGGEAARIACAEGKTESAVAAVKETGKREAAGAVVEQAAQVASESRETKLQVVEKEVIRYVERNRSLRSGASSQTQQVSQHAGTAGGPPDDAASAGPDQAPLAQPQGGDGAGGGQCALDADGLRLWAAAGRGELPDPAGQIHTGLQPAARGAGLRLPGGSAGQPQRLGAGDAPLQRPALGPDRLADGGAAVAELNFVERENPAPVDVGQITPADRDVVRRATFPAQDIARSAREAAGGSGRRDRSTFLVTTGETR